MPEQSLFKRRPSLFYFLLTFIISWGFVLIASLFTGMPGISEQREVLFPIALVVLLIGPMTAGLIMTGIVYGKEGFRHLRQRLFKLKVPAYWYFIVILATPAIILAILLPLSSVSADYLPVLFTAENKLLLLLSGIGVGLFGGFLEEIGWTGFVVPELRKKHSIFVTGLIVGLLWGLWHVLVTFWASGDAGGNFVPMLFWPPFLFYMGVLPVFRILMVWVYDRTESLFVVGLMHSILSGATVFILAPADTEHKLMVYYAILTGVLWLIVAVIALLNGGRLAKNEAGR